ncbi:MAG TPA: pyruvate, phosphate dikinase, partial [Thermoplasmata archaeon]|nr:pyruvate, phosphate dikinase [Thermoplasmata archaeon]
ERLERHYREMQDLEFTVERGDLYLLQTRTGKRTAQAAVRIAVDMLDEGLIDLETSLMRVRPEQLELLLHRHIDPSVERDPITTGLSASPGAAAGQVVFSADDAVRWHDMGRRVILVRVETKPDDIHGFDAAEGILTATGGMTSHAAVVARSMGKPCVAGTEDLRIDYGTRRMSVGDVVIEEGETITIDGTRGEIMLGELPMVEAEITGDLARFLEGADTVRRLGVRANADTPEAAAKALEFGAEGIGLCRTERMFNAVDRLPLVQQMVLTRDPEERRSILGSLFEFQKADFLEILSIMDGKPVVIRLLDPPLHEFLPSRDALREELEVLRAERALAKVHGRTPSVSTLPHGIAELVAGGGWRPSTT